MVNNEIQLIRFLKEKLPITFLIYKLIYLNYNNKNQEELATYTWKGINSDTIKWQNWYNLDTDKKNLIEEIKSPTISIISYKNNEKIRQEKVGFLTLNKLTNVHRIKNVKNSFYSNLQQIDCKIGLPSFNFRYAKNNIWKIEYGRICADFEAKILNFNKKSIEFITH